MSPTPLGLAAEIAVIVTGFLVLNQGAKFLTDNAVGIARRTGTSRFVMGTLVVSTLAALPELLISFLAFKEGAPELAIGNAVASNLATISLVIGLSAVVLTLRANREIILRDAVFLMIFSLVGSVLLFDGELSILEGMALILLFIPYSMNLLLVPKTVSARELEENVEELRIRLELTGQLIGREITVRAGLQWLTFGILWTAIGAQFVVWGAIRISADLGISEWLLGISVVAFGSTLPDIAAAVQATRRGYADLALGEGIGANIVTLLLTLGLLGLAGPVWFNLRALLPSLVAMNALTLLLLLFMLRGYEISRGEGVIILAGYPAAVIANLLLVSGGLGA